MYNRYIRNDRGTYTRIPEEDRPEPPPLPPVPPPEAHLPEPLPPPPPPPPHRPPPGRDGRSPLRRLLNEANLEQVDNGDLLLLALLFLLYRDGADEELLIALGLLLIL